jgi:hypothetical protein
MIEHKDNLMFNLLSQLLALALHNSIFAPDIQSVEDIYTKKILSHQRGMQLKIKREWLDILIFHKLKQTDKGYQTLSKISMKATTSG